MVDEAIEQTKDETEKPLSIVEEAKAVRDEIVKAKEELKEENDRKKAIEAEGLLSGTAGVREEQKLVSPDDKKVNDAKEFFKGTALEGAIDKANEKK